MKTLRIVLIAFCLFGAGTVKSQSSYTGYISDLYKAVVYTSQNWDKIGWVLGGMDHTWWYCRYRDGFTTYNNFRSYRTPSDAYNYFVLGHGDCDAIYFTGSNRNTSHICYQTPMQAEYYKNQHGPVIDLGFQRKDGSNQSILNY